MIRSIRNGDVLKIADPCAPRYKVTVRWNSRRQGFQLRVDLGPKVVAYYDVSAWSLRTNREVLKFLHAGAPARMVNDSGSWDELLCICEQLEAERITR